MNCRDSIKLTNTVILSFDADGKRAFGSYDKLEKDPILEEGISKAVEFLKQNNLDATFFVVGQNVSDFPRIHEKLKGFEIGNHTYSHPKCLTKKNISEKEFEIKKGHSIITDFFGVPPKMFRAPDYQIDKNIIRILKDMGYNGDSSLLKVLLPLRYFLNFINQKSLKKDNFEFPLTSFIIPFNGTSVILYGFDMAKLIFEYLLIFKKPIIINFHARDFVNIKINEAGFLRREKSLQTTLKFLNYMKTRCDIFSFRHFIEKH